jgi:DNA-binding NtrC family response regulator
MDTMDGSAGIALLVFDAHAEGKRLRQHLLESGYPVDWVDACDAPDQATTRHGGIAICLFDSASVDQNRKRTLRALSRLAPMPRLGLFLGQPTGRTPDIAFHCNEFLNWPAPAHDLHASIRRLCAAAERCGSDVAERQHDLLHLNLIGESRSFVEAIHCLERFSRSDAPVLIEGETGTGKELAARALHYLSPRSGHPFVAVNCGALPDSLLENELFGHARGAFTDARESHTGLVAQAENGTLFLDEVMSLSPRGQVALLRFLQEMEYRPLGSARAMKANVRVVAATNVPVRELAVQGQFRPDLLYRLNIMPVRLPPLREREDDVLLLAEHFLAGLRRRYGFAEKFLDREFVAWMRRYSWPGNVRELENLLHREFLLSERAAIGAHVDRQADAVGEIDAAAAGFAVAKARAIQAFEHDYLARLMAQSGGNVTQAARRAGKERRTFGKLLKKHGISTPGCG